MTSRPSTLLDAFKGWASNPESAQWDVVECAQEKWTYHELDIISTGLAIDLLDQYGPQPIVAFVSENHPYILSVILATWKLRGIVVPLDHHAPSSLMEHMLGSVKPSCVVIPSTDTSTQQFAKDKELSLHIFEPQHSTIKALTFRFKQDHRPFSQTPPTPEDPAIYIYTSSASSISNLKCVPLSHKAIFSGCTSQFSWLATVFPDQSFERLRVLGWSPWSHIMGISIDIGTHTFLAGGCYIFALNPSNYPVQEAETRCISGHLGNDVIARLLDTMICKETDTFAGVSWVLEGLMAKWTAEKDMTLRDQLDVAFTKFRVFIVGGAPASAESLHWGKNVGLPLIIGMGMTELGGPLFHTLVDVDTPGYILDQCLVSDASLSLVDDNGETGVVEGELLVTSKLIAKQYLKYDSSSFSVDSAGYITFRTGDIYKLYPSGRIVWRGRIDDYIQLTSGEILDPRIVENVFDTLAIVARSSVVGNNFLQGPSEQICAIIELQNKDGHVELGHSTKLEIGKALAAINKDLAPQLRISWSRLLVLGDGQHIPITKKRTVFRKKLQDLFGERLNKLLSDPSLSIFNKLNSPLTLTPTISVKQEIELHIAEIVYTSLGVSRDFLSSNENLTFAEMGMDSTMAIKIVVALNEEFQLDLPMNTCHIHVDLTNLKHAVLVQLGLLSMPLALPSSQKANLVFTAQDNIVIVGQALRLPGDLRTPESFWKALIDRRDDLMIPIPADRWDHASFYNPSSISVPAGAEPCDITFDKAGFIDIASFDNNFFGISPREALYIAPSIRATLEVAFDALENANIPPSSVKGTDMGVFVASSHDDGYTQLLYSDKAYEIYTRFYGMGVAISTTCGRLSYLLDIHGPSITVDTACSGGLVALDHAVRYLQDGDGESAIVCGANTHTWPGSFGFISAQQMASPSGRCATFSNEADGYVPSEGAVALILKTRAAAIRDHDNILGIVKATNVKHNGRSQGLIAPNLKAQVSLHRSLLHKSALTPAQIDIVEAHGTGTSLGDLIEIQGINEVFRSSHTPSHPLVIGASKTCIGHTETVSGLVGVVKTLLSFKHGLLPGLVHLTDKNLNQAFDCAAVPIHIPQKEVSFPRSDTPRRALVLSYGFAGTIAGTILEDDVTSPGPIHEPSPKFIPFVISAKTRAALMDYLQLYLDHCRLVPASEFHSLCYTTCVGRDHYKHRFACVVKDMTDLIRQLQAGLSLTPLTKPFPDTPRIILGFPGQGSQFDGMARDLADQYDNFRSILTTAAAEAAMLAGFPVLSFLLGTDSSSNLSIDNSRIAQVCIFVYQYSIAQWLETLRIRVDGVIGNSLGEIAAAVVSGSLTYRLALEFVIARAQILGPNPECPGAMAAIAATETAITQYIQTLGLQGLVVIAVFNSVENHVVSGTADAINVLISAITKDGVRAIKLKVDQGFHSPCISPALPALKDWLNVQDPQFGCPKLPMFSTLLGKRILEQTRLDSNYWIEHAKKPVRLSQVITEIGEEKNSNVVLDVGPQPTLWSAIQHPSSHLLAIATTAKKGQDQNLAFLKAVADLFILGVHFDFSRLFTKHFSKVQVPSYPWQRQRYYPAAIPMRISRHELAPVTSTQIEEYPIYKALYDLLSDHRIDDQCILPGGALAMFFALSASNPTKSLKTLRFHKPLVLQSTEAKVHAQFHSSGTFTMIDGNLPINARNICSGAIDFSFVPIGLVATVTQGQPIRSIDHNDVYRHFTNIHFGPLFRNISKIDVWADHAEALIVVEPSQHSSNDQIRMLDACLHMFGAIMDNLPQVGQLNGAFLPALLEGFTMYVDKMPSTFLCRYHLPIDHSRNFHVMSASFEVLSHTGDLLVSCEKYSVAWVPVGVAVHKNPVHQLPSRKRLQNIWIASELPINHPPPSQLDTLHNFDTIAYFGSEHRFSLFYPLFNIASQAITVDITSIDHLEIRCQRVGKILNDGYLTMTPVDFCNSLKNMKNLLIILDVTDPVGMPSQGDTNISRIWNEVLWLMKLIMGSKLDIANFILISTLSTTVAAVGVDRLLQGDALPPTIGAAVQGMLRTFRREIGLNNIIWGLDLPAKPIPSQQLCNIIGAELSARFRGSECNTIVSYRNSGQDDTLIRLIPVLRFIEPNESYEKAGTLSGISVIVGMGSIGQAIALSFLEEGSNGVFFLGRRKETDPEVIEAIRAVRANTPAIVLYIQADVTNFSAVYHALQDINNRFGVIRHVVHTAAVIKDSSIITITSADFEEVLEPKIQGAWNLHRASEELGLQLRSFVLLSSVSVPLGNPGQVAYVAGNAFMDCLAAYRQGIGRAGLSLQLGPWESKHIKEKEMFDILVSPITNKEGIPLVMNAIREQFTAPVQVIADLDLEILSQNPVFAKDPLFCELLGGITEGTIGPKGKMLSAESVGDALVSSLRAILELDVEEQLDMTEPLMAYGVDSIAFNQVRGKIMKDFGVEIPMKFLSDAYSIGDLVSYVCSRIGTE